MGRLHDQAAQPGSELQAGDGAWRLAVVVDGQTCLSTDGLDRRRYTVQARHGGVVIAAGLVVVSQ
jgi:hypothetical protein